MNFGGVTWGSLGFMGHVWGKKLMEKEFLGRSVLGPAFWSETGAAGKQNSCFRARGTAKHTIHHELGFVIQALIFTPQIDVL